MMSARVSVTLDYGCVNVMDTPAYHSYKISSMYVSSKVQVCPGLTHSACRCCNPLPTPGPALCRQLRVAERNKLIIILVGLPGRGKTFLCNKLKCYLNW